MSSVATVILEIGFDEEPISPVRREDTVTNRKPNSKHQPRADECVLTEHDLLHVRNAAKRDQQDDAVAEDDARRQIVLGPTLVRLVDDLAAAHGAEAGGERSGRSSARSASC